MSLHIKVSLIAIITLLIACGEKVENEACALKIRKEYNDSNLDATIEEGCIKKFATPNHYLIDGNSDFTVSGDTLSSKSIKLVKGTLITKYGRFVVKQNKSIMKLRLVEGSGELEYGDKTQVLNKEQVIEIGK